MTSTSEPQRPRPTTSSVANPRRTRLHGSHSGDLDAPGAPEPREPATR